MRVPNAKDQPLLALPEPVGHHGHDARPPGCLEGSSEELEVKKAEFESSLSLGSVGIVIVGFILRKPASLSILVKVVLVGLQHLNI